MFLVVMECSETCSTFPGVSVIAVNVCLVFWACLACSIFFGSWFGSWFRPYGTFMPYRQNQTVLDCCVDLGGHACPRFGEISLDAPDLGLDLPQLKFPAIVIAELDFGLWTFSLPDPLGFR